MRKKWPGVWGGLLLIASLSAPSAMAQSSAQVIYLPLDSSVAAAGPLPLTPDVRGNAATFAAGAVGRALRLGGGTTSVHYSPMDSLRVRGNETVELWARRDGAAPIHITNTLLSFDAFTLFAEVGVDADRNSIVAGFRTPRGYVRLAGTKSLSGMHWTHIALVVDSTAHEARLYVDGELSGSAKGIEPLQSSARAPLTLGSERAADAFVGWLDDVRIYDAVRSATDIAADAHAVSTTGAISPSVAATARPDTIPYRTVFDVAAQGASRQRDLLILSALLILLMALLAIHRAGRINVRQPVLLMIAILFLAAVAIPSQVRGKRAIARMVDSLRNGRYIVVEGRAEELTPPRSRDRMYSESFTVHSGERVYHYRYRDGENAPGFQQTTRRGGPLKPMMRVRIADIGGRIARLEIAPP